jgi:hypothetical protein
MISRIPSKEALDLAETLVNHQWGVSVHRLALALDRFRAAALQEALGILCDEGWLGQSRERIQNLINASLDDVRTGK